MPAGLKPDSTENVAVPGSLNRYIPIARRNVTPPSPAIPRSSSSAPLSAPPIGHPAARSSSIRQSQNAIQGDAARPFSVKLGTSQVCRWAPSRRQRDESEDGSSLQQQIDRLSASCEEHERQIRMSKVRKLRRLPSTVSNSQPPSHQTTIEHRLFTEFSNMFSRLNETDDQAEENPSRLN